MYRNIQDPAGYPSTWERAALTLDQRPYRIRPIRPDDLARDREFIMGLSEESRYRRLMHAVKEPSSDMLDSFVHVNYCSTMAFVAIVDGPDGEQFIGVARYASTGSPQEAEFAVAVADDWQRSGVGATLTRTLIDYARERGIHQLHGDVLVDNSRMLDMVRWLGMNVRSQPGSPGLVEATQSL